MNEKEFFLLHKFFSIKKLVNVNDVQSILPQEKNAKFCYSKYAKSFLFLEEFDNGIVRYNNPSYQELSNLIKNFLSSICDFDLYPSFYYDNFIFENQYLSPCTEDSDLSVLVKVNDEFNLSNDLKFKDSLGNEISFQLDCGDIFVFSPKDIIFENKKNKRKISQKIIDFLNHNTDEKYSYYVVLNYVYQHGKNVEQSFKYRYF